MNRARARHAPPVSRRDTPLLQTPLGATQDASPPQATRRISRVDRDLSLFVLAFACVRLPVLNRRAQLHPRHSHRPSNHPIRTPLAA